MIDAKIAIGRTAGVIFAHGAVVRELSVPKERCFVVQPNGGIVNVSPKMQAWNVIIMIVRFVCRAKA